jgi:hypothetical protein
MGAADVAAGTQAMRSTVFGCFWLVDPTKMNMALIETMAPKKRHVSVSVCI